MAPATPPTGGDEDDKEEDPTKNPLHVSNFNISPEVCERLENKGIVTLYGIQAQTFQTVLDGKDLVGRARTGCGKTLAFVLPIVEAINRENPLPASGRRIQGRRPLVALLAPTRSSPSRYTPISCTSEHVQTQRNLRVWRCALRRPGARTPRRV